MFFGENFLHFCWNLFCLKKLIFYLFSQTFIFFYAFDETSFFFAGTFFLRFWQNFCFFTILTILYIIFWQNLFFSCQNFFLIWRNFIWRTSFRETSFHTIDNCIINMHVEVSYILRFIHAIVETVTPNHPYPHRLMNDP